MRVKRRAKKKASFTAIAMADIAFLLLIFFIITSAANADKEIPIELPSSKIASSEEMEFFNVWISDEGAFYYDGAEANARYLTAQAKARYTANREVRALIRAPKTAPYEWVNAAMEAVRKGGVNRIVLVSKPEEGETE